MNWQNFTASNKLQHFLSQEEGERCLRAMCFPNPHTTWLDLLEVQQHGAVCRGLDLGWPLMSRKVRKGSSHSTLQEFSRSP